MPGLVWPVDFYEEAGLKFALTFMKENKVGKNVWNLACFYQRTGEGLILGHSECCWDIATTYFWQSARNSLSAIFVFLRCSKIGQWTVTLLLPSSISRELVFVIHTLYQDSSSKLVFTEQEETKRLAQPCLFISTRCRKHVTNLWGANIASCCSASLFCPAIPPSPVCVLPSLAYIQHKFYYFPPRGVEQHGSGLIISSPGQENSSLFSLSCSMHKVLFWIIFTGQSGTTMSP